MASGAMSRAAVASPAARVQDLIVPVAIIASILVILVPLPTALMDLLLAANITVAVIMLLTAVYVRTPLEFSIFPSLLLATTLFRLVLNVATTRLILTDAEISGMLAAGGVIKSFGQFVTGDKIVVGLIIFAIIVLIQFVVITKGASRISEVAARFMLDGMPGRQMAIDADLSAGIIDEHEAQQRRQQITAQADFFGAMDGASKFVRGDAIAGIAITLINIGGGLFVGMAEAGMSAGEAASLFTKLTIGDGLVSQVPAFLIALAAGLLVTRSSQAVNLPNELLRQLFSRPQVLVVAGCFLGVLIFTSLPRVPLFLIGTGCVGLAVILSRQSAQAEANAKAEQETKAAQQPPEQRIEDYLAVDPMEVELGVGLIRLADPKRGGDLLQRVQRIRQQLASEIGIVLPKVRIRDNMRLQQNQYRIKIADLPVAEANAYPHMLLAVDSGTASVQLSGTPTEDPISGKPAVWIEPDRGEQAQTCGYSVVDPGSMIAAHLTETVRRHADEILTRDATKHLIDQLKQTSPAVVDELIPGVMKLSEVQQILQMLLRESVPVRQLAAILETLGDFAPRTKDPVLLTEHVRGRLARAISSQYRDRQNRLYAVTLDPALEDRIQAGFDYTDNGLAIRMSSQAVESICRRIAPEVETLVADGHPPIVLVSPEIRPAVKQMTLTHLPHLIVLSYHEITRDTTIESLAVAAEAA
jgi:flagellar biosynthesis protein FlhA